MKRCAVVELGDHYHLLKHSQALLSGEYICDYYLWIDDKNSDSLEVIRSKNLNIKEYSSIYYLFFDLLNKSSQYDIVYFQTLLDNSKNIHKIPLLFFLFLNKTKVVASIRNGMGYLPSEIR